MSEDGELFRAHRPPRNDLRRIAGVGLITFGLLALWTGAKPSTAILYGAWYRPYELSSGALLVTAAIALWLRRRWGAWLGAAVLGVDVALVIAMGEARWPLLLLTVGLAVLAIVSTRR